MVSYREEGFTLVELITAVAIIGILVTLAIPSYSAYIETVRVKRAISEMRMLEREITAYLTEEGRLPDGESLKVIGRDGLMDPWGHPYKYLNIADGKGNGKLRRNRDINPLNSDYDLYSTGKDGEYKKQLNAKESRDDIVRTRDGAYIGLASEIDPDPL